MESDTRAGRNTHGSLFPRISDRRLLVAMKTAILLFVLFLAGHVLARPFGPVTNYARESATSLAGTEILKLPLVIKLIETFLAVISVTLAVVVYGLLIRRASLMSTASMYPCRPIETNIGELLRRGWPSSSQDKPINPDVSPKVQLFYLGKMLSDNNPGRVAKGIQQCAATPEGPAERHAMWLTSGSPITRSVVQLLVWEWASLWLMFLMLAGTLMYNGFFTNEKTIDSYPRLAVTLIYAVSYLVHFLYVWYICLSFLSKAAAGASWSLLERANFAVIESQKLSQSSDATIELKGIDKSSAEYVSINIRAVLHHRKDERVRDDNSIAKLRSKEGGDKEDQGEEDLKEVSMALRTISAAQENERTTTRESANNAHDRIVSNSLLVMGITVASAFSSWTSFQTTENTPNNFNTSAIGSMALLTSLSLGVAALLSSALHLSIMDSSFWTILSLKEIKINGQAVDHYKKRRRKQEDQANLLSFTEGTIPVSRISFLDIVATNHGVGNLFKLFLFGPAYTLLPKKEDHGRTSAETGFDFRVRVRDMTVLLTTRVTNAHMKTKYGDNVEAINVCYIDPEKKPLTPDSV